MYGTYVIVSKCIDSWVNHSALFWLVGPLNVGKIKTRQAVYV